MTNAELREHLRQATKDQDAHISMQAISEVWLLIQTKLLHELGLTTKEQWLKHGARVLHQEDNKTLYQYLVVEGLPIACMRLQHVETAKSNSDTILTIQPAFQVVEKHFNELKLKLSTEQLRVEDGSSKDIQEPERKDP